MSASHTTEDLHGRIVDASDPEILRQAIELAFNYRGDVTIARSSGESIEGYIFDRTTDKRSGEPVVRIIPRNSDERIVIPIAEIAAVSFSGKDTASGKSFETWIRKYAEKKLAGEKASIESESLDGDPH
jgi:hypothetical protein